MTTLRSSDWTFRPTHAVRAPTTALAVLAAAGAAPILVVLWLVPGALVLPVVALIAFAASAVAAASAWLSGAARDGDHVTLWDAAGAFAFIGCAAAVLTGSEHVTYLFGPVG